MMNINDQKRLGELLIEQGLVEIQDVEAALGEQQRVGGRIGEILIKMGRVTDEDVKRGLSTQLGIPFKSLVGVEIPRDVIALMPARM
ncbi:hypothetical protein HYR69_08930, partial [Candidatus Sumerlaeota bacterium]|nr:hypothetical protein [Candidatus Sumerlaeota bacterium]